MADDQQMEECLIKTVTDHSGNLKKELKKSIYETVSNLRNLTFIHVHNLKERKSKKSEQ